MLAELVEATIKQKRETVRPLFSIIFRISFTSPPLI